MGSGLPFLIWEAHFKYSSLKTYPWCVHTSACMCATHSHTVYIAKQEVRVISQDTSSRNILNNSEMPRSGEAAVILVLRLVIFYSVSCRDWPPARPMRGSAGRGMRGGCRPGGSPAALFHPWGSRKKRPSHLLAPSRALSLAASSQQLGRQVAKFLFPTSCRGSLSGQ